VTSSVSAVEKLWLQNKELQSKVADLERRLADLAGVIQRRNEEVTHLARLNAELRTSLNVQRTRTSRLTKRLAALSQVKQSKDNQ
jgi:predicted RNase H-like nuclease (RuvC/YqgF family)